MARLCQRSMFRASQPEPVVNNKVTLKDFEDLQGQLLLVREQLCEAKDNERKASAAAEALRASGKTESNDVKHVRQEYELKLQIARSQHAQLQEEGRGMQCSMEELQREHKEVSDV